MSIHHTAPHHEKATTLRSSSSAGEDERFVVTVCEIIGYAAFVSWMPFVLLTNSFEQPAIMLPAFVPDALTTLVPRVLCLLLCLIFGIAALLSADIFNSKKRYMILCVAALAVTMTSFFIPIAFGKIIVTTAGYVCCYIVWKVYLLNKKPKMNSILISLACSGVFLAASSLLNTHDSPSIPPVLVLVSLLAFFSVSDECFKTWLFTPKESIQHLDFSFSKHVFPLFISVVYGAAIGTMITSGTPLNALVLMGTASVAAALSINAIFKMDKQPSRSFTRGLFAVGSCCAILALAVSQEFAQSIVCTILLSMMIINKHKNEIKHSSIAKDTILSESFLSGYRIATSAFGACMGLLSCAWVATAFPAPSNPHFAFYGFLACLFLCGCLINLGVFNPKRDRLPTSKITDLWHEKVMFVAEEADLSPRQTEIFDALSRGRNTKYIMQRLYLSEGTVKKQTFQIYRKLEVHTQQELISLVMNARLDDADETRTS